MAWATDATDVIDATGATVATVATCTDATTTKVLDSFSQRIHRVVTLTFLKLIGSPFRFRPFDLIYAPPKAGI